MLFRSFTVDQDRDKRAAKAVLLGHQRQFGLRDDQLGLVCPFEKGSERLGRTVPDFAPQERVASTVDIFLDGGVGVDTLTGLGGNDYLSGGADRDKVDYSYLSTALVASLALGGASTVSAAAGDTDVLSGIEDIVGGSGDDTLDGNLSANELTGGAGDDTLRGHAGNDTLLGGDGSDTADFTHYVGGMTATLDSSGTVTVAVAAGETDVVVGIENIVGALGDDRLVGDAGANRIDGSTGNDTLSGLEIGRAHV